MRVLHWKWFAVLVILMFVTILRVSVYHKIGDHAVLLEGVTGGVNGITATTSGSGSSSSSR